MSGRGAGKGAATRRLHDEYTHPTDQVRAFTVTVMDRMGATLPDIAPGELVRFDAPDKPRGNRSCWAVLHLDGRPAGAFGNWRTGETHSWRADGNLPTREDREQTHRIIEAAKRKREQETSERNKAAAEVARGKWQRATPATVENRYIAAKRVPALGVRVLHSELLIPLRTVEGELVNLQRVKPTGSKLFLKGGRIRGCFCLLSSELPRQGEIYICEGWATAATIHVQTGLPVAAAMNAGNLVPVADAIRAARPGVAIVLAADYDHCTPGNPGLRHAREAARAVDGAVTWPNVCRAEDCRCTDFNDVANCGRAPA